MRCYEGINRERRNVKLSGSPANSTLSSEVSTGQRPGDGGGGVGDGIGAVVVNELRRQTAVSLDQRLADDLRDLVDLVLLRRELLLHLLNLFFQLHIFVE